MKKIVFVYLDELLQYIIMISCCLANFRIWSFSVITNGFFCFLCSQMLSKSWFFSIRVNDYHQDYITTSLSVSSTMFNRWGDTFLNISTIFSNLLTVEEVMIKTKKKEEFSASIIDFYIKQNMRTLVEEWNLSTLLTIEVFCRIEYSYTIFQKYRAFLSIFFYFFCFFNFFFYCRLFWWITKYIINLEKILHSIVSEKDSIWIIWVCMNQYPQPLLLSGISINRV